MVSTAKYFLPRLLAEFQREHEGVELRLAVGNREQLVKMLHNNEVDIAVMGRPPKELATRAEPFAEHPLLKVGHPTVDSLRPYGFILRERGSGTRMAADQHFRSHRFRPDIRLELGSNEAIKEAVAGGLGIFAYASGNAVFSDYLQIPAEVIRLHVQQSPLDRFRGWRLGLGVAARRWRHAGPELSKADRRTRTGAGSGARGSQGVG